MDKQFLEIQTDIAEKPEIKKDEPGVKLWLLFPCIAAVLLGLAQFTLAEIMRYTGDLRYQYGQCLGFALCAFLYNGSFMLKNKINQNPILSHYDQVFKNSQGKWKTIVLFGFISRCICQAVTLKFFALVNYYAIKSGTSPSIMICITASSSSLSSVIMFLITRERLSKIQITSIFFLSLSVFFICGSKAIGFDAGNDTFEVPVIVPIIIALILTCLISANQILGKFAMTNGYHAQLFTSDLFLCQAVIVFPMYLYQQIADPYDTEFIFLIAIQAMLFFSGQIFQNIGLEFGKVGVNIAITQNSLVFQFILETVVYQRLPSIFEVIGILLCMGGIAINAFKQ